MRFGSARVARVHKSFWIQARSLIFSRRGLLVLVPVLALAGLLPGCAGLAGLGVEGGVHETSVTPPPPEMAVQLRSWVDRQGKYHSERVMEKLKDPSRPAHLQVLQATWRDKNGEEHQGTVAALVADPPPQREAGVPSRDAWVVVMWRYAGSVSDGCVHGTVVRTDAAGKFHAHGWIDPLNFGPEFYPWRRYQRLVVYKPGYAIADTGSDADIRIGPAGTEPFVMLHPLTGGLQERLKDLSLYLDNPTLNCANSSVMSPPSPQMAPFLAAMVDEAGSLAKTKRDQLEVERKRYAVEGVRGNARYPDPDAVRGSLTSALAVHSGTFAVARALDSPWLDLNEPMGDGTPILLFAVEEDDPAEYVALLLAHGADPNMRGREGYTPLQRAVSIAAAAKPGYREKPLATLRALLASESTCTNVRDAAGRTAMDAYYIFPERHWVNSDRSPPPAIPADDVPRREQLVAMLAAHKQSAQCARYDAEGGADTRQDEAKAAR